MAYLNICSTGFILDKNDVASGDWNSVDWKYDHYPGNGCYYDINDYIKETERKILIKIMLTTAITKPGLITSNDYCK